MQARQSSSLPGSGRRFDGRQPAMRVRRTTQLPMSGRNGRTRWGPVRSTACGGFAHPRRGSPSFRSREVRSRQRIVPPGRPRQRRRRLLHRQPSHLCTIWKRSPKWIATSPSTCAWDQRGSRAAIRGKDGFGGRDRRELGLPSPASSSCRPAWEAGRLRCHHLSAGVPSGHLLHSGRLTQPVRSGSVTEPCPHSPRTACLGRSSDRRFEACAWTAAPEPRSPSLA